MGFAEVRPPGGRAASAAAALLAGLVVGVTGCSLDSRTNPSVGLGGSAGAVALGGAPNTAQGGSAPGGSAGAACDAETRCSAEGVLEVCRAGEWAVADTCKGPQFCSATRRTCLSCAPGTFACLPDGALEQCSIDGSTWEIVRQCGSPAACNADADTGYCQLCTPGEALCESSSLEYLSASWPAGERARPNESLRQCNTSGSGTLALDTCRLDTPLCSADVGRCLACTPGKSVCNGRFLSQCNAAGSALRPVAACASAALCDATNTVCQQAGCAGHDVGSVICEKTTLSVCRASGAWEVLDICASEASCSASVAARECLDATATRCTPGSSACNGNTLRRCATAANDAASSLPAGTWYDYAECAFGCRTSDNASPGAECVTSSAGATYVETSVCEPGATSYSSCSSSGCTQETCEAGKVCAGSALGCTTCVPGTARCVGNSLMRCDAKGESEVVELDCSGAYCDKARARCLPAAVGERYCDADGHLLSVNADGTSRQVADCRSAALCDVGGCLTPTCVPGSVSCGGADQADVYECKDGVVLASGEHCAPGGVCVEGLGCARAVRVTAGDAHTCALVTSQTAAADASGYLFCWGANELGQLGNGATLLGDEPEPRPVLSSLADAKAATATPMFRSTGLCAGRGFTCADIDLPTGGVGVACFGANDHGQLGQPVSKPNTSTVPSFSNGIAFAVPKPVEQGQMAGPFIGLHAVTCGADFACALDEDSRGYCWGANDYGQLGAALDATSAPPSAISELGKLFGIVAGGRYACAMDAHYQVYCWGDNSKGVLGQGLTPTELAKSAAPLRLTGILADNLGVGQNFAFAVDSREDSVASWGQNLFGQLATGGTVASTLPLPLPATRLDGASVLQLVSGPLALHACALSTGSLSCWGANPLGELGDGTRIDRSVPTLTVDRAVIPLVGTGGSIALGKAHSCAIAASGRLYCWGANQRHQLGSLVDSSVVDKPVLAY